MYNLSMNIYKELFLTTTDTVTGIGAPVSKHNEDALMKIKNRSKGKKFVVMVASLDDAKKLNGWTKEATKIAEEVWPGQVTIIVSENLAVRVPSNSDLQTLLKAKGPCYMTSANYSGEPVMALEDAKEAFYEIHEFYDFGKQSGKPSTLINLLNEEVGR